MRRAILVAIVSAAWVAAACGNEAALSVPQHAGAADSAEQVLAPMQTNLVEGGIRRAFVQSDTTFVFDRAQRLHMIGVKADFYNENGVKQGSLTAQRGVYNRMTEQMEAFGDVQLLGVDGRRLNTQQLRYNKALNEITGDSAFTAVRADGTLRGVGFKTDPSMTTIRDVKNAQMSGKASVPDR
ncbi:MAG TPA: LPS export ABC transporter periplasmic protein LptC [Gemmatimonadaceae bacterium]|nr:LPS export ABC transporter periplasmic protein LptC [Gemmatimonadaceae bacterium]